MPLPAPLGKGGAMQEAMICCRGRARLRMSLCTGCLWTFNRLNIVDI